MRGPSRHMNHPRPGYFRLRLVARGPWVPARIERPIPMDPLTGEILERGAPLVAYLADREVPLDRVWLSGFEIDKDEYEWLRALHPIQTK